MRELCCTECGRNSREGNGLFEFARYPSLRICWRCIKEFQRWILDNMGPEYTEPTESFPMWLRDFVVPGDLCWPTKDMRVFTLIPPYQEIGK